MQIIIVTLFLVFANTSILKAQDIYIQSNAKVILPTSESAKDGKIELNPWGGLPPYHYFWSNGDTTSTIDNLNTGKYLVIITDSNNKVVRHSFDIKAPMQSLKKEEDVTAKAN